MRTSRDHTADHTADRVSLSPPLCPDVSAGSSVPAVALDRGLALSPSVRAWGHSRVLEEGAGAGLGVWEEVR